MIDQKEVQHLIRQNKKIKAKIVEQARVFQEERSKLKSINRSLQKTLEEEQQKNRATIEEFNAQIIALEAELKRVKSNEPQVTPYTTPRNRPLKPISFAQLEAESKRLSEETNRIIQQNQKPRTTVFLPPSPGLPNNTYQASKFSDAQNYRTRYQFNLSNNYSNSINFNQSPQQFQQQKPQQQQFQQQQFQQQQFQQTQQQQLQQSQQKARQSKHGKTQPFIAPNNNNNTIRQENHDMQQANQENPQKNSTVPNQQINSNTFPFSNDQQANSQPENIIIEEEEEELDLPQNQQTDNEPNNYNSDDTIPADNEKPEIDHIDNDTKDSLENQNQNQQDDSQDINESPSNSLVQSNPSSSNKDTKSSPPKVSINDNMSKNKTQKPNVIQNSDKKIPSKTDQKAATSPGISVIINDDSKNSEDPFADNFLTDDDFREEEPKADEQPQKQQEEQQKQINSSQQKQLKPSQKEEQKPAQKEPQTKTSSSVPKKDFMNEISSAIFDDISFNHDGFGSDLDMQAAFDDPVQANAPVNKADNNKKDEKTDNKGKKSTTKQDSKKNENQDDANDIHVPSANSWSFPSSQIQIEGFD